MIVYFDEDAAGDPLVLLSERRNGAWVHPANVNERLSLSGSEVPFYSWTLRSGAGTRGRQRNR